MAEGHLKSFVAVFVIALALSLLLTPLGLWLGKRLGVVAEPGGRRRHVGRVSLIGGIGLFLPFLVAILVLQVLPAGWVPPSLDPNETIRLLGLVLGCTLAFAFGPLFITWFVASYGLGASPFAMILGLPVMVVLFKTVPLPEGEALQSTGFIGSIREAMGAVWKSIVLIGLVAILRTFVSQSFMTFMPILYAREGYSLISLGLVVSLFTVAGTLSGLLAGHLSDRIGHRPVFFVSHLAAVPLLVAVVYLRGNWIYPCAFLAGFFVMATLPLGVALAHSLLSIPYVIFIAMGVFETIPRDLDEQAQILGASKLYSFTRIIIPVALPGLAAAAIYVFLLSWDEFIFAYFLLAFGDLSTLPVLLKKILSWTPQHNLLAAISVMLSIPVMIFTFLVQKYMRTGATAGAVK